MIKIYINNKFLQYACNTKNKISIFPYRKYIFKHEILWIRSKCAFIAPNILLILLFLLNEKNPCGIITATLNSACLIKSKGDLIMSRKITFGIIGVGNMGSSHMRSFMEGKLPELELTAVADINPERLEWAKEQLPNISVFNTASELIHSGKCEAIVIATPHYDHPPIAIEALKAGLHVMTEKPAGVYTKQVREMIEVASQTDRTFAIMFNQRTNVVYRKLRELVQSGEYGEIRRVNWIITDWFRTQAYYDSGGWRATWAGEGGGVLINQCPHNLDLWQWICGMPNKIWATCHQGKWHNIEVEDDVTIYAEYPNGATGVFIATTGDCPGTNRLEITMDKAKIVCENNEIKLYVLDESISKFTYEAKLGFAKLKGQYVDVEITGESTHHPGVLNAFAANILRGEPLYAHGSEGINSLMISNAAYLSSWLGRPVELPLDEDLFYEELKKRIESSNAKKEVKAQVQEDMSSTYGS